MRKFERATIFIAGCVALASTGYADPVYLSCSIAGSDGKSSVTIDVTLNVQNATASMLIKDTGSADENLRALFTATQVAFQTHGPLVLAYTIDRNNLSMVEAMVLNGKTTVGRTGRCTVVHNADRKF